MAEKQPPQRFSQTLSASTLSLPLIKSCAHSSSSALHASFAGTDNGIRRICGLLARSTAAGDGMGSSGQEVLGIGCSIHVGTDGFGARGYHSTRGLL